MYQFATEHYASTSVFWTSIINKIHIHCGMIKHDFVGVY